MNYVEHLLILASTFSGCVSISAFASVVSIPVVITSCAVGLKVYVITAGIKVKVSNLKKRKNMKTIVLLARTKLNSVEVLISGALIDPYVRLIPIWPSPSSYFKKN